MSIPNGTVLAGDAKHRAIQMNNLKRTGLRVGAPDLFLAIPSFVGQMFLFAGLFIELKAIGGEASPAQLEMATLMRKQGYNAVIAEGFLEAQRAIMAYLGDAAVNGMRLRPATCSQ
jgi:hypothetical protein